MINDENEALIEEEIEEELDKFNSNSFATLNSIHPANDIRAKWKLSELFLLGMDAPSFISELNIE